MPDLVGDCVGARGVVQLHHVNHSSADHGGSEDLAEAREFYSHLFGRGPDMEPMPTLAQWDIQNGGGVQVVEQSKGSGSSMVTLLVTDFDGVLKELSEKRIEHGEVIDGVISRVTQVSDPAGNIITFAEADPAGQRATPAC